MSSLFSKALELVNTLQREYYTTPYEDLVAMGFLGRIKHYDWSAELVGLAIIAVIAVLFTAGAQRNRTLASGFIKSLKPVLEENFAQVGVSAKELYIKDSSQYFTSYATGRINIAGLTIKINLAPRQNLFMFFAESIFSQFFESIVAPEDQVFIVIQPHRDSKIGNYVFSIVNKNGMNKEREENYFLSLSKTTESSSLSSEFVFMSESSELNNELVTPELTSALSRSGSFLKFIAITDLPVDKPTTLKQAESHPEIIISLKLDNGKLPQVQELVKQVIELVDRAAKFQLKPDQQKKINNVRAAEIQKIQKAIQDQKEEELKEQRLEAEREARRAQEKLSPEAQEKLDKKQKEKRERRARNKQVKRY